MLSAGFNLRRAMQDALGEKHFKLARKLLSKNPSESVLQETNKSKHNLLHTLAMHGGPIDIASTLVKKGVNPLAIDSFGRAPLHYAARGLSYDLCKFFIDHKANIVLKDVTGKVPLHHAAETCSPQCQPHLIGILTSVSPPDWQDQGIPTSLMFNISQL